MASDVKQVTVRGQKFWVRPHFGSQRGRLYQAVGAGNAEWPSDSYFGHQAWHTTARDAAESLRQQMARAGVQ